ncbi:hypothetical protein [Pseudomonas soli]|uniref:hypothetical protein n=1 Tax=Pseudomonas soli TaxID=1306993 RepID=UPI00345D0BFD
MKIALATGRDSTISSPHSKRGHDGDATEKKSRFTLVGKNSAVKPIVVPEKKGGGQLMGKNVLKSALVDIVVGVVIGHILALSTGYGDMPPTHHEAQPKLMYVERQAPASDGDLAIVARRW